MELTADQAAQELHRKESAAWTVAAGLAGDLFVVEPCTSPSLALKVLAVLLQAHIGEHGRDEPTVENRRADASK